MVKYLKTQEFGDLPICLSYSALKHFQEKTGKSLMEQGALQNIFGGEIEELLYFALESGFKKEKKDFNIKREQMEEILDDCLFDFVRLIPEFFPKEEEKPLPKSSKPQKK